MDFAFRTHSALKPKVDLISVIKANYHFNWQPMLRRVPKKKKETIPGFIKTR